MPTSASSVKAKKLPNFKLLHQREQQRVERFKVRQVSRTSRPHFCRSTDAAACGRTKCALPCTQRIGREASLAVQEVHGKSLTRPQPFRLHTNNFIAIT
eukprot:SAG31_NODE_25333_length_463_cov_1.120879_1_plen_98_part_01